MMRFLIRCNQNGKIDFIEEPSLPRKKRTSNYMTLEQYFDVKGLASKFVVHHSSDACENFQLIYFEVLDSIISVIKDRFMQLSFQAYIKMESFFLKAIVGSCTEEEHDFLHENYHRDIEVNYFEVEKEVWETNFRDSKPTCFRDIHKTIKAIPSSKNLMIPTFTKVCELILLNPAVSCKAEKSYSTARCLKTWLRSTMTNQRFNSPAILNTYKSFTDKLDLCKIVKLEMIL